MLNSCHNELQSNDKSAAELWLIKSGCKCCSAALQASAITAKCNYVTVNCVAYSM